MSDGLSIPSFQRGYLSEYFEGVAYKILSAVEADPKKSNQHELNVTKALKRVLGSTERKFETLFLYFEGEQQSFEDSGTLTLYDSRKANPLRSAELRAYYTTNAVSQAMEPGNSLFLARLTDDTVLFIVTPEGSTISRQIKWLFGISDQATLKFETRVFDGDADSELDFVSRQILEMIGIEIEDPNANTVEAIVARYKAFPPTKVFSKHARDTLPGVDARDDPDAALMMWLEHEEAMFRSLEARLLAERVEQGFLTSDGTADVDAFVKTSLSVQNRRKSRMGHSLEHHVRAVLDAHEISYADQFKTAKGKKPDFLFPSAEAYVDPDFPDANLTLLAAKSTCKDRWSQVLSEADRIQYKHLLTLEAAISPSTTDTMRKEKLQLVVPQSVQRSYSSAQQDWLMDVGEFVALVGERQAASLAI